MWTRLTAVKPTPQVSPSPTATASAIPKSVDSAYAVKTQELLDDVWERAMQKPVPNYRILIEPGYERTPLGNANIELVEPTLRFLVALGTPVTTDFTLYVTKNWSWFQAQAGQRSGYCYNSPWVGGASCPNGINVFNLDHFVKFTGEEHALPPQPQQQAFVRVTSHEMAHQAQRDYAQRFNREVTIYPSWLREGGAEVVSTYVYARTHGLTYLQARDQYFRFTSTTCRGVGLMSLNSSRSTTDPYAQNCQGNNGYIAAEVLIGMTGTADSIFRLPRTKEVPQYTDFEALSDVEAEEALRMIFKEVFDLDLSEFVLAAAKQIEIWAPTYRY